MNFELQPMTGPGQRLVALAEAHAPDFATRADRHDREGSFPFENFAAMRHSGLLAAGVPLELGGLGVTSLYDLTLASNRLGRADGSTAIATTMHLASTWYLTRQRAAAQAAGNTAAVESVEASLRRVAAGELIIAMLGSEAGTDLRHPLTEATRVEGGWLLNGSKTFGTLSPVAQLLGTRARVADGAGGYRLASVRIPRDTPGLTVKDNWDALGMRASGSHDVVFENCFVPDELLTVRGEWGDFDEPLVPLVALGLTAAFLGIAEAARALAIELVTTRRSRLTGRAPAERYAVQQTVALMEIELAAARALFERSAQRAGAFLDEHPPAVAPASDWHALYKECQCAKWFVNRTAITIVDRALTVSGGAGYLSKSPLARLYRDVRAGPFMAPLTETEALQYIGTVALGLEPTIEP